MSPRAVAAADTFRRWWPVLFALGLGLVGYGTLRQRVADAETTSARIEARQATDETRQLADHDLAQRVDEDIKGLNHRFDDLLSRLPPPK